MSEVVLISVIAIVAIITLVANEYAKIKWSVIKAELIYFIGAFICMLLTFIGFVDMGGWGWGIAALYTFVMSGISLSILFQTVDESLRGDTL